MVDKADALQKMIERNAELLRKHEADRSVQFGQTMEGPEEEMVPEVVGQTAGRMGLVSPESRQAVRQRVVDQSGVDQFFTEMSPSLGGAMLGGSIGAFPALSVPTGGMSIPLGAAIGGIGGELFGQETGISPESDAALILSGAGGLGPGLAAGGRAVLRGLSKAAQSMPSVRAAASRITMENAAGEFESVGTQIVGRRTGLAKEDAYSLYAAAKQFAGADVPVENFQRTFSEIEKVLGDFEEMPGMEAAAARTKKALEKVMSEKTQSLGVHDVMKIYKSVNELRNTAAMTPEAKKVSDELFKMFDDDIDMIVKSSKPASERAMKFTQAAFKRSELDRAVQSFERGVANFTKQAPESNDVVVNVKELRAWLFNKTNPKHGDYDKRMAEQLKEDLPDIKKSLDEWTKIASKGENPGGPSSLVIRNIGAKTGAGVAGYLVAGPVGAGVGAIAGSKLPEGITSILLTPTGRKVMTKMLEMGKGTINHQRWALLAQIATNASRPLVLPTESFIQSGSEMLSEEQPQ